MLNKPLIKRRRTRAHRAGPVDPEAKDSFKWALAFSDDYSGAVFVCFLKAFHLIKMGLLREIGEPCLRWQDVSS